MMKSEPQCVRWKRSGAKKVMKTIARMTPAQELEYWRKETELWKKSRQE